MVNRQIERFEVWLVELSPTKGREINKTRPCVVISPAGMLVGGNAVYYLQQLAFDNKKSEIAVLLLGAFCMA